MEIAKPIVNRKAWKAGGVFGCYIITAKKKVLPYTTGDDALAENLRSNLEKEFRNLQLHKVEEWERQQEDFHLREGLKALSDSIARQEGRTSFETGPYARSHP